MIKAIETVYRGYRFRSRLEARWAVFFDTLGVKYEYEKEGYDLDGTWYLPDFWLPELDCWVEVKGEEPTKQEQMKLAQLTGKDKKWIGILLSGTPDLIKNEGYAYAWGFAIGFETFVECLKCGTIGMIMYNPPGLAAIKGEEFYGFGPGEPMVPAMFSWRLRCNCQKKEDKLPSFTTDSYCLIAAYTSARQARFERGK